MSREELEDKLVNLCLDYIKKHGRLMVDVTFGNILYKLSNLMVSHHGGNISEGARSICDNRTTVSERLRTKCDLSDEELKALCEKHGVFFHPRKRHNRMKLK